MFRRTCICIMLSLTVVLPSLAIGGPRVDRTRTFELLHGLPAAENAHTLAYPTMGLFRGPRATAPGARLDLDFIARTYTRPGWFALSCSLEKATPDEGRSVPHADLFLMAVPLDLERYRRLFESTESIELARWEDVYDHTARAWSTPDGTRYVLFHQDNARDEDTRRGELTVTVRDSRIVHVKFEKWAARRSLNPFAGFKTWEKVLSDEADTSLVIAGMQLNDDYEIGRISRDEQVRVALNRQTERSYREALGMH